MATSYEYKIVLRIYHGMPMYVVVVGDGRAGTRRWSLQGCYSWLLEKGYTLD